MAGHEEAMNEAGFSRAIRAEDQRERTDGNVLRVGKGFEVAEAEAS